MRIICLVFVILCIFLGLFQKLLDFDDFDDFTELNHFKRIQIFDITDDNEEKLESSLIEALKRRFIEENRTSECFSTRSNSSDKDEYRKKFSKVSKNFLSMTSNSKKALIINLANNYLAYNQTNKQKTGSIKEKTYFFLLFRYFAINFHFRTFFIFS